MTSRQTQMNLPSFTFRSPPAGLHLTVQEWALIVKALSAYQHNQTYRPLYEKLVDRTS